LWTKWKSGSWRLDLDCTKSDSTPKTRIGTTAVEKSLFERHGYFVADRVDHAAGKLVFNLAVGLKDSRGK